MQGRLANARMSERPGEQAHGRASVRADERVGQTNARADTCQWMGGRVGRWTKRCRAARHARRPRARRTSAQRTDTADERTRKRTGGRTSERTVWKPGRRAGKRGEGRAGRQADEQAGTRDDTHGNRERDGQMPSAQTRPTNARAARRENEQAGQLAWTGTRCGQAPHAYRPRACWANAQHADVADERRAGIRASEGRVRVRWAHERGGRAGERRVQTGSARTLPSAGTELSGTHGRMAGSRERECGGRRAGRMEGEGIAARTTGAPLTRQLARTLARSLACLREPPRPPAHSPTHPPIRSPTRAWTCRPAVPARDPYP
ncbi:uncharacterized protein B0H18DRAFT_228008 [Fomitopsis serialis]|uniref:uncharacterized protein n=1 Tax=Fomitopsis serialis TaxID=139415 RepID=UPI002007634D|nr:uncharacterized protein B0H18DRAFT_228008 [Neoantrodia serialis]KAH9912801.1 hypothetical protein B0H18DRAFT_228008 [Neoantrodia serialis]